MDKLKLFVVGEQSSDPDRWSGEHAFVIAHDAEEASAMVDYSSPVTEMPMDKPMVLCHVYYLENL
jgi:hypothetical protein